MQAWDKYLKTLESELGKPTVDRWLRTLKVVNYDAANLYLEASDTFSTQWFIEYAKPRITQNFFNENNRLIKVHLQTAHKKPPLKASKTSEKQLSPGSPFTIDPLDPSYTFDQLVEISQNRIILKLLQDFENFNPKTPPLYNPITLFGSMGIGKTHLLQAVANTLEKQNQKVCYVKAATFTYNMVAAIKLGQMSEFRKLYRKVDVLIVDDIQYFAHKKATQEEFFHTFNALHTEGKQIILSSNISPQQLKEVEPRLISRFEWGIALPLQAPNKTQLEEILELKLKQINFLLTSEAKDFLLQKFSKSPKTLHRALSALILRAHLKLPQGKNINSLELEPDAIEKLLGDLIKKEATLTMTADRILEHISLYFGIKVKDILGKSQSRECVLPRQMSMFFCRKYLKLPYMKIGRIFSRDHSTVMSSVKQVQKNISQKDHNFEKIKLALEQMLFPSSN